MNSAAFDWKRFHAYRVFDEILDRFILNRKSYVTRHETQLDLAGAFEDIRTRFIGGADESKSSFEDKVAHQFQSASEQTKIVFANVEYLWAMPMQNITPERKRSYALRWFSEPGQVVSGERYFFSDPFIIADPGPWYLTNRYWEIIAALRGGRTGSGRLTPNGGLSHWAGLWWWLVIRQARQRPTMCLNRLLAAP